jgi:hypothetical protein
MKISETEPEHEHCWHDYRGAIHMVIPDGHLVQKCCKCDSYRTVHADHIADKPTGYPSCGLL